MCSHMHLILVRHADAVPEGIAGSDRDRWLSDHGREMARVLARLLRGQGVSPDLLVSSPLPRAVQTAELLASGLGFSGSVESWRCLEPQGQPKVMAAQITARTEKLLIVGHEPSLSMLGAHLTGNAAFPAFRTAQALALHGGRPVFSARADVMAVTPLPVA